VSLRHAGRLTVLGSLCDAVDGDGLVVGLAAVFAGTTVLLAVLAFAYQPFLLLFAVPFGVASYFLWYHASGRLTDRVRRTAARDRQRRANAAAEGPGGFEGFGPGRRAADARRERADDRSRERPRRNPNEPSIAEAYRTLGVDPGADEEAVRDAYRELAKSTHPDADSGDEEEFKRVNRAYERLIEE
jgi:hypothetical protein